MSSADKPFSLRLPPDLMQRVDVCVEQLRLTGLAVSRTDVARMLIVRALDGMGTDPRSLLAPLPSAALGRASVT